MQFRIIAFLFFLSVACEGVSGQPLTPAQQQAEDIINRVLESRDARLASINNYTVVVKSVFIVDGGGPTIVLGERSAPAIEYYERVAGEEGAVFRLVPLLELAGHQNSDIETPTGSQVVEGLATALEGIGGEFGADLSDQSDRIRGIEINTDLDYGEGAIRFIDIMNLVADHATEVIGPSMGLYTIVADVSGKPEFEGRADRIILKVHNSYSFLESWFIHLHYTSDSDPYAAGSMGEINHAHLPSPWFAPYCISTISRDYPGVPDTYYLTLKVYTPPNLGAPSVQRQAELFGEANALFQNMTCGGVFGDL